MNDFEKQIAGINGEGLHSVNIETLQVNLGLLCNQRCTHCHLEASPQRDEIMEWPVMELVLEAAKSARCQLVDLTGGAPELNPHFRRFVAALRREGHPVQVRTNLTVLLEPGMEELPEFFREHQVQLVASMPCYLEENVCAQRGKGVYEKSVAAIKRLNAVGLWILTRSCLSTSSIIPGDRFFRPPSRRLKRTTGASWVSASALRFQPPSHDHEYAPGTISDGADPEKGRKEITCDFSENPSILKR